MGVNAVEVGFVGEFLLGEAEGGGREVVGAEEREENREDLWVAVYENRVRVVGRAVGKIVKKGVWTVGADSRERCLEELTANVELDAVTGVGLYGGVRSAFFFH